jgi:uncharacterized protein YndB with AHSA1/START domain
MSDEENVQVRVSRRFDTPAERVFDAWLDPRTAGKWLFATPHGQMVRVEIDGRIGGYFALVDRRDGDDVEHLGEYVEIDRPHRLVFTFRVPKFSALSTKVALDIVPSGSGCELTVTHEGVLSEYASRAREGWTSILERLAVTMRGGTENA